jgi:hypothetical protein
LDQIRWEVPYQPQSILRLFRISEKKNTRNTKSTNQIEKNPKTVCLVPQMWKGANNLYGSYPPEFEGSTQNQEKMPETPNLIHQSNRKKCKSSMFGTSNVERSPKFVRELPAGIGRLSRKPRKMPETPNQPIKSKKIQKQYVLYFKSEKEPKIYLGAT